jgi:hypothetical protein
MPGPDKWRSGWGTASTLCSGAYTACRRERDTCTCTGLQCTPAPRSSYKQIKKCANGDYLVTKHLYCALVSLWPPLGVAGLTVAKAPRMAKAHRPPRIEANHVYLRGQLYHDRSINRSSSSHTPVSISCPGTWTFIPQRPVTKFIGLRRGSGQSTCGE